MVRLHWVKEPRHNQWIFINPLLVNSVRVLEYLYKSSTLDLKNAERGPIEMIWPSNLTAVYSDGSSAKDPPWPIWVVRLTSLESSLELWVTLEILFQEPTRRREEINRIAHQSLSNDSKFVRICIPEMNQRQNCYRNLS